MHSISSRPRLTLFLLAALSALAFMDRQILAVLVVPLKAEFALTDLQLGLVSGLAFSISFGIMALPLGRLADRVERRRLVAWCRGLGGVLAALGALAGSAWLLALTRCGSALSDAGGAPASMSMIADLYPPQNRAKAMGLFTMGATAGALLAMVGGAALAQHLGWRTTLAIVGLMAVAAAVLFRACATEPTRQVLPSGAPATDGVVRMLLADPVARALVLAASFALLAGYSFGAWNFAYLVRAMHLSPQQAGWISGLSALGSLVAAPLAGHLSDRVALAGPWRRLWVPIGGLALALPLAWAYLALPELSLWLAVVLVIAFSFFLAFWIAPVYAALSMVVAPQQRAQANAILMLVGAVGGSGIGPVLTGALSDALVGHVAGDPLGVALALAVSMLLPAIATLGVALRAWQMRSTA